MHSSYIKNNFGELFTSMVKVYKPTNILEFGCLEGYSTSAILEGLKFNGKSFKFQAMDLFEDYPFHHANFGDLVKKFPEVDFVRADFYKSDHLIEPQAIDFMHIDVSNTALTFQVFVEKYFSKLKPGGIAVLEGGSKERDEIEWMNKYKKPKIHPYLQTLRGKFEFLVITPFPSVTIFVRQIMRNLRPLKQVEQ